MMKKIIPIENQDTEQWQLENAAVLEELRNAALKEMIKIVLKRKGLYNVLIRLRKENERK